jgi:hypothetical protein
MTVIEDSSLKCVAKAAQASSVSSSVIFDPIKMAERGKQQNHSIRCRRPPVCVVRRLCGRGSCSTICRLSP